ncbi:hypothetical protein HF577_31890, partial [Pseudonocardia xinjiangensis]|nr:hypothetical protein [Pseudonocardia xinjiangensis]
PLPLPTEDQEERTVVPLLQGVVRHGGQPVHDAVLTVVDTTGRQLGHARTDADGRYRITRAGDGHVYLLVVQGAGTSRAEYLQAGGLLPHDIDLDLPGEAFPAPLAGRSRRLETAEATT